MSVSFKSIEIASEMKRDFVDFAIEAHSRFPDLPDIRKAVITQVGQVVTVTLPVKEASSKAASSDTITQDFFFEIAEDMFTIPHGHSVSDPIAWVA